MVKANGFSYGTSVCRTPSGQPVVVQVGFPADLFLCAGMNCEVNQRNKRERLCRYIARPAVAIPRLSLSSTGKVVCTLKTRSQRLKRVFNIDIEVCDRCGGAVKVIVDASNRCIEEQEAIDRILTHLRRKEQDVPVQPILVPTTRALPGTLPLFSGEKSACS